MLIESDALSALVEEARLSRPQTVKRIWDYVKARDLQDPSDKRFIMCDDRLKLVFHTDRLHMFTYVLPSSWHGVTALYYVSCRTLSLDYA